MKVQVHETNLPLKRTLQQEVLGSSILLGACPWGPPEHLPETSVGVGADRIGIILEFTVREAPGPVIFRTFQDPVWQESCVELFLNPFPDEDSYYLNLESNRAGTLLAAWGRDRFNRRALSLEEAGAVESLSASGEGWWKLAHRLPWSLLESLSAKTIRFPYRVRANFTKCGDRTRHPHWGSWVPLDTPSPDFHRPERFGSITFLGGEPRKD